MTLERVREEPEELPEHLLSTAVANYLDPSKVSCPVSRRAAQGP